MEKKVLITGAGGNLGQACVNEFQQKQYEVIAILSPGKKLSYATASPVSIYNADLMNEDDAQQVLKQIIEDHQTIDTALLLVGGFSMGNLEQTKLSEIRKMIDLNFDTAFHLSKALFSHMTKQGGGRIAFVGARPALDAKAAKDVLAYALSKTLVVKLSEILNAEGKDKNIVTSVFIPSIIDTPNNRKAMPDANPNNWVKPEVIAEIIEFTVSGKGETLREPVVKIYGKS